MDKQIQPFLGSVACDNSVSDVTFATQVRGLLVTGSGNLKIDLEDDSTLIVPITVSDYKIFSPFLVKKVYSVGNGCTATVLAGLR